ncbi:MAG: porin [Hyphomonadaceae bacterium]|nr:porin [Hyphomonadaceae bacterium]
MQWTLQVAAGALALSFATGASAEESGLRFTSDGLEYRSPGGDVRAVLGGRVHADMAAVEDNSGQVDDEELRRARLELRLRLFDDWRLRLDHEFTSGGGWRNAWIGYDATDHLSVRAGNFIAPFSMEDLGSSNETMFMERSLAQTLAPGYGLGAGAFYEGRHFSLAGAYFDGALDSEESTPSNQGRGAAARLTYSPIEHRRTTLHLGAGIARHEFDTGDVLRFTADPEAHLASTAVRSGAIADAEAMTSYNLEAAFARGPLLLQAQFITTEVARTAGADLSFDGHYAQAGWIITGESYRYGDSTGVFRGPRPRRAYGALELAARASSLDLSEAGPTRGSADNVTLGLNWYVNQNVRLMANYVHSEVDAVDPAFDNTFDITEARLAVSF